MLIASTKEFRIQQDEELKLLRIEWVGGQNLRNFQGAFGQLIKLISELAITQVVLDLNTLPDVSVYDQLWLSQHFMPALARLPLKQAVIVLRNERVYNHQVLESLLADTRLILQFDIQFFTQVEPALQWLTDNSPRLPLLQAEWAATGESGGTTSLAEPRQRYHRG